MDCEIIKTKNILTTTPTTGWINKLKIKIMKAIIKLLSSKRWVFELSLKIIANRIVHCQNLLTPEHLKEKGFIQGEDGTFYQPDIKDRDKIWIEFEHHYYRVWHGRERTFIALESKLEWFETYYLFAHGDNGRYELANV